MVVQRTLDSIEERCADLERDSLCLVSQPLEVQPAGAGESLAALRSLSTGGLDADNDSWGLALLRLGANLPQTYPGAGLLALLAGDAQIQNEIDASEAVAIPGPVSTAALERATLYRQPGILPEPIGALAADEIVPVDAYDLSGDWLRAVTGGMVAWLEAEKVARLQAMDSLPRLALNQAYPLRALSLQTGSAYPDCAAAEPMVAVQTPEDASVNLTVNGVDIHIGSMVTFQQAHKGALGLTVHRGAVTTVYGQRIEAGQSAIGILAPGDASQPIAWSGALPASSAEVARGERAQSAFNRAADANGWEDAQTHHFPSTVLHVVKRGESLYSIARYYRASVEKIIAANPNVEPRRIFAGTRLTIPDAGAGFASHGNAKLGD